MEGYDMYTASATRYEKMKYNRCGKSGQLLPEMALAWLLRQSEITSVLIGASKPSQITANIKALENTDFTDEELKGIDSCHVS